MNINEQANALKEMSNVASDGELSALTHLFGINYAKELKGMPLAKIAILAGRKPSMKTEIAKGMKLAKYVEINERELHRILPKKIP